MRGTQVLIHIIQSYVFHVKLTFLTFYSNIKMVDKVITWKDSARARKGLKEGFTVEYCLWTQGGLQRWSHLRESQYKVYLVKYNNTLQGPEEWTCINGSTVNVLGDGWKFFNGLMFCNA